MRLEDNTLIKFSSYLSVFTAVSILIIKSYGWFLTYSQSLLASLVDTVLDISSSSINLIALIVSLRPPDDDHRFGHEKFQDLAVFSQAIFFFASSIFTLISAIKALINHSILDNAETGTDMMLICVALTFILICYQGYVIKKTNSNIIAIDRMHYTSDLLTNFVIIGCINFSTEKMWYIDPIFGILISLYIAFNSFKFFKKAIKNLSDEELSNEDKEKIIDVISKHKEVKGIHGLKTRYAANKAFIQCHLEMDGMMSLLDANKINDQICTELLALFKGAEITIRQEPENAHRLINYRENITREK